MECYYHPDRESTDVCGICGKAVCEECGLEIAGKVYCEECLTKIIGLGASDEKQESEPIIEEEPVIVEEPVVTEPVELSVDDNIYQIQEEDVGIETPSASQEYKVISEDSPYNIRGNIEASSGLESSYIDDDTESLYQNAQNEEVPQTAPNELNTAEKEIITQKSDNDFIYPDHDYEPQPTSARQELEDKYEKYLDDLYFDEEDVPLGEQLAKDEEKYGSLTKKEYAPRKEEAVEQEMPSSEKTSRRKLLRRKKAVKEELPEEIEEIEEVDKKLKPETLKEKELVSDEEDKAIHNLSYQDGKEPMGIIDILLTIILILLVLLVLYYLLYLFLLNASYPTFMDALFALRNPQNVINAILTH